MLQLLPCLLVLVQLGDLLHGILLTQGLTMSQQRSPKPTEQKQALVKALGGLGFDSIVKNSLRQALPPTLFLRA